jgi:hypothetical protein
MAALLVRYETKLYSKVTAFWDVKRYCCSLELDATCSFETTVDICQTTLRHIQEDIDSSWSAP